MTSRKEAESDNPAIEDRANPGADEDLGLGTEPPDVTAEGTGPPEDSSPSATRDMLLNHHFKPPLQEGRDRPQ